MTTTATILSDDPQAADIHRARYLWTHTESGQTRESSPYGLASTTDTQTFGDDRTPAEDIAFKEAEIATAQAMYYRGVDMDDAWDAGAFEILTQDEMREVCVRDAANLAIPVPIERATDLANAAPWTGSLSPAVLSARLTNSAHTWTNQEASAFSSALNTLKVALDQLQATNQGEQNVTDGIIP